MKTTRIFDVQCIAHSRQHSFEPHVLKSIKESGWLSVFANDYANWTLFSHWFTQKNLRANCQTFYVQKTIYSNSFVWLYRLWQHLNIRKWIRFAWRSNINFWVWDKCMVLMTQLSPSIHLFFAIFRLSNRF